MSHSARPITLAGYLALNRGAPPDATAWPARPEGPLVWLHIARGERLPAVIQLGLRLLGQRAGLSVLLTVPEHLRVPERLKQGMISCPLPADTRAAGRAFVAHMRPDLCIWTSGDLLAGLIDACAQANVPLALVDAAPDGFGERGLRRLARPTRAVLSLFATIFASDELAAQRLTQLGVAPESIAITGPLQEGSAALPCREDDLEELTQAIGPRPVWLAAMVQPEEARTILRAQANAARFSHRLLLVMVPDKPDMADAMAAMIEEEQLRSVRWSHGEVPDDQTEVLLADTYGEMGLWYRLASVSFMGSSLVSGAGGCDPFEPAALGSAILYGPNCGRHLHAYSRLVEAGAARMVRDADSLTAALRHLMAPDRAAMMSLAAWEVVSEGAQVADQVSDMVLDVLDRAELA